MCVCITDLTPIEVKHGTVITVHSAGDSEDQPPPGSYSSFVSIVTHTKPLVFVPANLEDKQEQEQEAHSLFPSEDDYADETLVDV